jgi:hypothetical protein
LELLSEKLPTHLAESSGFLDFNMPKICDTGQTALLPLRKKAGFEPANLGTKGQHATSRPPKPLLAKVGGSDVIFKPSILRMKFLSVSQMANEVVYRV